MTRPLVVGVALAALACVFAPAPVPASADGPSHDSTERRVIGLLNHVRARQGLARLRPSRPLGRAADRHTRDMIRRNFFDHTSSDGTSFGKRLNRYTTAGQVGENIGYLQGSANAAPRIVRMWMHSAGHRAMILEGSFRKVGVGGRKGRLGRSSVAVFTADFASR
jgi:uncharacterized protein YkwD